MFCVFFFVKKGQKRALHWRDAAAPLEAELCLKELCEWSCAMPLDRVGDVATHARLLGGVTVDRDTGRLVRQRRATTSDDNGSTVGQSRELYLLGLRVRFNVATFEIEVHDAAHLNPPYRIENCTGVPLVAAQQDVRGAHVIHVEPYAACGYTWDRQIAPHVLAVRVNHRYYAKHFSTTVKLDKLTTYDDISVPGDTHNPPLKFRLTVRCDGATRVLRVTDVLAHRPELTLEESFLRRRNMANNDTAQQPASTPSSPSKSSPHANHMPSFVYASNLTPTSRRLVTRRRARAPKQSINKTSSTLGADAYAGERKNNNSHTFIF